jgi:hypothetical protein
MKDVVPLANKFQSPVLSNIYVLPDIRSDIYFEIVGPTAFLSVRTDGPTVFEKSEKTEYKSITIEFMCRAT